MADGEGNEQIKPGDEIRLSGTVLTVKNVTSVKGLPGKRVIFEGEYHPIELNTAKRWSKKFNWFEHGEVEADSGRKLADHCRRSVGSASD